MKITNIVLVAAMALPSMVLANSPTTTTKPAAPAAKEASSSWTLNGVTAANKSTIIASVEAATGGKATVDETTGLLTVTGGNLEKVPGALPKGITAKK